MHAEYDLLCEAIPTPACALHFKTPFQLLIATVLSAQTTDVRVNSVTPELFDRYPTPASLAAADPEAVEDIIHPLGFFRSKSAHIIALSHDVHTRMHDAVPLRWTIWSRCPVWGAKPPMSCSATPSASPDSRSTPT